MYQSCIKFSNPDMILQADTAHTFFRRAKGLLGTSKPRPLLIYPGNQIHTIGMHYPIDVIYFDKQFQILRLEHDILPGKICSLVRKAYYILELPSGFIEQNLITEKTLACISSIR